MLKLEDRTNKDYLKGLSRILECASPVAASYSHSAWGHITARPERLVLQRAEASANERLERTRCALVGRDEGIGGIVQADVGEAH